MSQPRPASSAPAHTPLSKRPKWLATPTRTQCHGGHIAATLDAFPPPNFFLGSPLLNHISSSALRQRGIGILPRRMDGSLLLSRRAVKAHRPCNSSRPFAMTVVLCKVKYGAMQMVLLLSSPVFVSPETSERVGSYVDNGTPTWAAAVAMIWPTPPPLNHLSPSGWVLCVSSLISFSPSSLYLEHFRTNRYDTLASLSAMGRSSDCFLGTAYHVRTSNANRSSRQVGLCH
jgi:hypothetical protein